MIAAASSRFRWLALAALWLVAALEAHATSYTILTTVDDAVPNGNCTLREALRAARDDVAVDACPAGTAVDTILLPPGTYTFLGEELLNGTGGRIRILGQTLNPFDVRIDLATAGRFLSLLGSAFYEIRGVEIANGWVGGGQAGGAIEAFNVDLTISDFRFVSNHSARYGGALSFSSAVPGSRLLLVRGTFQGNGVAGADPGSKSGGAAHVSVSITATADLRDVAFLGNSVAETGPANAQSVLGGALFLSASSSGSHARCARCLFQSNSISNASTALVGNGFGGGLAALATGSGLIEILDSRFLSNSAATTNPLAISVPALSATLAGGWLRIDRILIDFNAAAGTSDGRDLYVSADGPSELRISNAQITFGTDAGLHVDSLTTTFLGHLTIADYPGAGAVLNSLGVNTIHLENSVLALNGTNLVTTGPVQQVTNFVGGDPQFVNQPGGDYHLQPWSPAVDSGTDSGVHTMELSDLDHEPRRVGPATDRGCYEIGGLFADDFASGDPGAWSSVQP